MDKNRQSLSDKLIQPEFHDPYLRPWHERGDTFCPQCGVTYQAGRWTWQHLAHKDKAEEETCPACRRIAERVPAGQVTMSGSFVKPHSEEICHIVRHAEELEKPEHPLERLMSISDTADGLLVTTTGMHLAKRLAHALDEAFKGGELHTHYKEEDCFVDIHWKRD